MKRSSFVCGARMDITEAIGVNVVISELRTGARRPWLVFGQDATDATPGTASLGIRRCRPFFSIGRSMKKCSKCGEVKPLDMFHRDKRKRSGRCCACRACQKTYSASFYLANKSKYKGFQDAYYDRLQEAGFVQSRVAKLRFVHNDTLEQIAGEQGGCGICKTYRSRLIVNHDHATKLPRGLLCLSCNMGLGHLEKAGEIEATINYLLRTSSRSLQWCFDECLGLGSFRPAWQVRQAHAAAVRTWRSEREACEICGDAAHRLMQDHDHRTGRYRGVLCIHHNFAIGKFRDRVNLLQRAQRYLARTSDLADQQALFERLRAPYDAYRAAEL